jgi:DNA-binding transcriptional ArsR family regulator
MAAEGAQDAVFAALSDPTRRRLMALLSETGQSTPTELAAQLPVSRQAVAKHLGSLAGAGLVESSRAGREVRYRLTPEPLSDAVAWMADVGGQWDTRLAALERTLARR